MATSITPTRVGETLPFEVTVITLGQNVAINTLPGEVFVELGLAITQGSPFRTTLVIEFANCAVRRRLRLDLAALCAAGFGVGGARAVVGFLDQSMGFSHISSSLSKGVPLFNGLMSEGL